MYRSRTQPVDLQTYLEAEQDMALVSHVLKRCHDVDMSGGLEVGGLSEDSVWDVQRPALGSCLSPLSAQW